jgi:hypothetical protein
MPKINNSGNIKNKEAEQRTYPGFEDVGKQLTTMWYVMTGIIIVFFVTFLALAYAYITLVHNDYKDRTSTLNQMSNELYKIQFNQRQGY